MVSSLTAIRFQVNDLNDQTAAQGRHGKWGNEYQHGWFVGWLDGRLDMGMNGLRKICLIEYRQVSLQCKMWEYLLYSIR